MRVTACAILGALLAGQPAVAATLCKASSDRTMFEVEALKSELIVLATSCHQSTEYNAFVGRYQPALVSYDHALDAYFKRTYGRAAEREHDAYITNLANAQSDVGLVQGTDFCPRNDILFHEVMALDNASELPLYAAGKDLVPSSLGDCVGPAPVPTRATRPTHSAPKKRSKA